MAACCHDDHCAAPKPGGADPRWRCALWIALAVNAGMFTLEIAAGVAAGSASLQADALDFLGDAANYAISLGVAGMALGVRTRAALLKGGTLIVFALWVLGKHGLARCMARCRRPRSWGSSAWPRCSPMAASR